MNAPLPHQRQPDWRRYVIWMTTWVAFIAALGYAASEGGLGFLENDVSVVGEANRSSVTLTGREPPVIQVKVKLRNNTAKSVVLKVGNACKIFRWHIYSRSGELMQAKTDENVCPAVEAVAVLPSGKDVEEFYSILLVPARYTAGDDYQVRYWYWGYEGEFQFKAE